MLTYAADATTYGTLLGVCARAGTWQKALVLDETMARAQVRALVLLYH
jgi:hypothetical protein